MRHFYLLSTLLLATVAAGCGFNVKQLATAAPIENHIPKQAEFDVARTSWNLDDQCLAPDESPSNWRALSLWDRIRHGYLLPEAENERIDRELRWFAKHPEYIERVSQRGQRYLHYIVGELEKRDMPLELAYLPIVESGFDPFAYSPGRASGMWQIIPGTARELGLKDTWWYDGRRDAIASTEAALTYLTQLHKRFNGDWFLAIAAYNSGGGRVSKAVRTNVKRGIPADFWHLDLPRETEAYVPRLLALAKLFKHPERYGVSLQPLVNEPYFSVVDVGSQIDLAQAAKLAEIDMDDLYHLNPGFNRWATDPNGPHTILVPKESAPVFKQNLLQLPKEQRVTWRRHKIRQGETLSHIAAKHNVSVETLATVNRIDASRIRAGKTLMVPKASKTAEHYSQSKDQRVAKLFEKPSSSGRQKQTHTVKSGESFWRIAKQYNVSSAQIAKWNGMSPKDTLSVGKELVIWLDSSNPAAVENNPNAVIRKLSYRVRKGDSLAKIANKFRVTIPDIAKWNQINTKKYLQPGQALVLFVDVKG